MVHVRERELLLFHHRSIEWFENDEIGELAMLLSTQYETAARKEQLYCKYDHNLQKRKVHPIEKEEEKVSSPKGRRIEPLSSGIASHRIVLELMV
jgi:hypothetical protein